MDTLPTLETPIKYSKEFLDLIRDIKRFIALLKNNDIDFELPELASSNELIKLWEEERRPVANFINQGGTILDFGCANGFLLRCFQEWSKYKLDPYGIDPNNQRIKEAKEVIYPNLPDHFLSNEENPTQGFPKSFNIIYWNIWDNWIKDPNNKDVGLYFSKIYQSLCPGGRIIFGLYNDSIEANLEGVKKLENDFNLSFKEVHTTSLGRVIVFLDKPN